MLWSSWGSSACCSDMEYGWCFCAVETSVLAQSYPFVFVLEKGLLDWVVLIFLCQPRNWTGYNRKKQCKIQIEG